MSAVRYLLDKSASRFTVRAFASGMLSALGHDPVIAIRDFRGEAAFDPAALDQGSLKMEIRSGSFEVTNEMKSKDRRELEETMNQKVLEIAKYPEIVYQSVRATVDSIGDGRFKAVIDGNLSLHGVTGRTPVAAQLMLNGDTLRSYGEFSVVQSDFGIVPIAVAGGGLKLKDELKFSFDIVARKSE